jgi:hypothetical protein
VLPAVVGRRMVGWVPGWMGCNSMEGWLASPWCCCCGSCLWFPNRQLLPWNSCATGVWRAAGTAHYIFFGQMFRSTTAASVNKYWRGVESGHLVRELNAVVWYGGVAWRVRGACVVKVRGTRKRARVREQQGRHATAVLGLFHVWEAWREAPVPPRKLSAESCMAPQLAGVGAGVTCVAPAV